MEKYEREEHDRKQERKEKRREDKYSKSKSGKKKNFYDEIKDHEDSERNKTRDRKRYDFRDKQSLEINVLDGINIVSEGIPPLDGRDARDVYTHINDFKELKPSFSSSAIKILESFRTADTNTSSAEANRADYILLNLEFPTYNQMPTPSFSSLTVDNTNGAFPTQGSSFSSSYTSYNTKRLMIVNDEAIKIQAAFNMNESYSDTPALVAVVKQPASDTNTVWGQLSVLTAWADAANTNMLALVTTLKMYSIEQYLAKFFAARHPQFAQYFEQAYVYVKVPKMKMFYQQAEHLLKQMPCDVEWVDQYSNLLTSLSRRDNSYYSPIFIPQAIIAMPYYQIGMASGQGLNFTPNAQNINFRSETSTAPYYDSATGTRNWTIAPQMIQLLQNLQNAYNGGVGTSSQLQAVTKGWISQFQKNASTFVSQCSAMLNMFSSFITLFNLAYANHATRLHLHDWKSEYEVKFAFDQTYMKALRHPEFSVMSRNSSTGQLTMSLAMNKGKVDIDIADANRMYALSLDSVLFTMSTVPNSGFFIWSPWVTQSNSTWNGVLNTDGTWEGLFMLPFCVIQGALTCYSYNANEYTQNMVYGQSYVSLMGQGITLEALWEQSGSFAFYEIANLFGVVNVEMDSQEWTQIYFETTIPVVVNDGMLDLLEYTLSHTSFTNTTSADVTKVASIVPSGK